MIKRLKTRRHSSGTMVANPYRKKRNGGHKRSRKKKRGLRSLFANPRGSRKRKAHNPRSHKRRNPLVRRKRRNPDVNIGGVSVDLVSVGIGSVAAIALGSIANGVANRYFGKTMSSNPYVGKMLPSLLVAGGAWAAAKYMQNPKIKSIAKVTLVLAVFKAIDDSFGEQISKSVKNVLPGTSGYIPAVRQMNGVHIDNMGGAYTYSGPSYTHGVLPGANLYGL
jgi:hypothetical protein